MAAASPAPEPTDEDLLLRIAQRDVPAYEIFYARHAARMLGLLRQMLGEEREAEEALQAGCLTLWDQLKVYDPETAPAFAWVVSVFRREAIERLRALDWRGRPVAAEMLEKPVLETHETTSSGTLALKNLRHHIQTALKDLPVEQRRWIESAFLKGLTCRALAESSGQPEAEVRKHLRSGVLHLRQVLKEGETLPPVEDLRQVEQAALLALHALEDAEQSALEIEMARDDTLERLALDLDLMISSLACVVPVVRPSPEVRAAILATVQKENRAADRARQAPASATPWMLPLAWGVAAVLAVTTFWLWTERKQLRQQVTAMTATEAEARQLLISVRDERDALEATQLASLDPLQIHPLGGLVTPAPSRPGRVIVVFDPARQTGAVQLDQMPAPEPGKVYQLWLTPAAGGVPVPVAVIPVDAAGQGRVGFKPVEPVAPGAVFSLSLEREGGVPQPEGEVLFRGA